jgi:hypothetical protein
MNSAEFQRWLKSKGAKFDRSRGNGSHMYVTLNGKTTVNAPARHGDAYRDS